jgi:hypothetical protein
LYGDWKFPYLWECIRGFFCGGESRIRQGQRRSHQSQYRDTSSPEFHKVTHALL